MISITPWKQSDSSLCGPAVVKMVMGYYGLEASESEVAKRCNHTFELGCTDVDMKRAFESYGFSVNIYNESNLETLEYCVERAIPVIVDWFSHGVVPTAVDMANGHSSIVVDVDEEKVYLLDPEDGKVRDIRRDEFMRVWFDWKGDPYISPTNLVVRQIMIARPSFFVGPRFRRQR